MKLLDLYLRAFGSFTDQHLDLSGGNQGLHVVFGLNEAGKSSALRALRALLYGIPERTRDDFLHNKTDLRVGGRFRAGGGDEVVCYRRKGRKNTLLDEDDGPIAEDTLRGLLGGVEERLFEHLFAIDHASLVSGGQSLLEERGREAEALFGTGLGSTALHRVLESLDQEAQALFAPRASKPLINAQLSELIGIERRLREVSVSARSWDEARKTRDKTKKRLGEIAAQLAETSRRHSELERIRRTLPGLAKRTRLRERLASLGAAPTLAGDFGQRREQAAAKRSLAGEGVLKARSRLEGLEATAAALEVSENLLAEAEAIDALREQLGSHRKAARDRPGLVAKRAAQEEQARKRLAALRPDLKPAQADQLRSLLGRRRRATDLGGRREALEKAVKEARARSQETEQRLAVKRGELQGLAEPPPCEALRRAVEAARRAGDLDRSIDEWEQRVRRHEDACARDLAALGLWTRDLAALASAPLPSRETLGRFSEQFQALDDAERGLEQARADILAEQRRARESIRELELTGTVPSEAELRQARDHRDAGWRLVKRQWIDGEDIAAEARDYAAQVYTDGAALPAAFEDAVAGADEVADRLRREAQRVHEQASLQARLEACARKLGEADTAVPDLAAERQALKQSWRGQWEACGVEPLSAREMTDWLARALQLREKAGQGDGLREQLADLCRVRQAHLGALSGALTALGESVSAAAEGGELTAILGRADDRLTALEVSGRKRAALAEKVLELQEASRRFALELDATRSELASWRADWFALMGELGLAGDARPGEVSDYLQSVSETLRLRDEIAGLETRIAGIDGDTRHFGEAADDLLARLAPDLRGRPLEEAVLHLHARLGQHRETKSRLVELQTQARLAEEEARAAEAEMRTADEALGALCRQAGCERPEELLEVQQRFEERQQLAKQLREVEDDLIQGGDGLGIEELEREARAVDRDAVLTELTAVEERIEQELQPEREGIFEAKVNADRDFVAMAGGDEAAALAEEAQQTLSSLRAHAERYVRLKLAGRVLRDEIERFRRRHRDPILSGTSGYFAQLTCGSFAAVDTDFDEADQPVLVGVRPNGERLRVEAMSTGTHDQLYLALRLATLEHYMDRAEPLPFIVDDILIQFDDQRARATLDALADFSAKSQVILFTHHGRVAEQAAKLEETDGRVFCHKLG